MACPKFEKYKTCKDPDSIIDYGRNWGPSVNNVGWLETDETIITSGWNITTDKEDTPTLLLGVTGIGVDGKATVAWLSGGTVGISYNLTNTITTSKGRTEDRTGILTVAEK